MHPNLCYNDNLESEFDLKTSPPFYHLRLSHSVMGMVMTLEISNMDKIYIFGTLRALGITWHMQFFPLPSLPKSLLSVSPILP